MIYEYALEPEMVAAWGDRQNHRFFLREFGPGQGRLVSRYPKSWARKVWESFNGTSQMERKRLEELLVQLQETMVKRKDTLWNDAYETWQENALLEHGRHPFHAVFVRNRPQDCPEVLDEDALAITPCPGWDNPHGITIERKAVAMAAAVEKMLTCCRWVKFVDPHISPGRPDYKPSLRAFLSILTKDRPVGPPEAIEIHTRLHAGTANFLLQSYQGIIPAGLRVTLYQWQERTGGQRLHNRYLLTDLGGVSFNHGLDTGREGETDDLTRLDLNQYILHCDQYSSSAPACFEQAAAPLIITGTFEI